MLISNTFFTRLIVLVGLFCMIKACHSVCGCNKTYTCEQHQEETPHLEVCDQPPMRETNCLPPTDDQPEHQSEKKARYTKPTGKAPGSNSRQKRDPCPPSSNDASGLPPNGKCYGPEDCAVDDVHSSDNLMYCTFKVEGPVNMTDCEKMKMKACDLNVTGEVYLNTSVNKTSVFSLRGTLEGSRSSLLDMLDWMEYFGNVTDEEASRQIVLMDVDDLAKRKHNQFKLGFEGDKSWD